ncbi:MAG: LicD family protein, partial [Lachnospiraceae bacterium]|nr:LicD family protein [Lachnospiraceae bacterium]
QLEIKGIGVTIDLFPIDGVPKKRLIVERLFRYSLDASAQITALQDTNYKKLDGTFEYWRRIFAIKLKAMSADLLSRMTKVDKAKYVAGVLGKYGMDEIVRHDDLCEYVNVEFCDKEFLAPKGYKIYLTKHYGKNYMKLPPESQRRALHPDNFYWL